MMSSSIVCVQTLPGFARLFHCVCICISCFISASPPSSCLRVVSVSTSRTALLYFPALFSSAFMQASSFTAICNVSSGENGQARRLLIRTSDFVKEFRKLSNASVSRTLSGALGNARLTNRRIICSSFNSDSPAFLSVQKIFPMHCPLIVVCFLFALK